MVFWGGDSTATIKYNSAGVQQWIARYYGSSAAITIDGSGNVYTIGNIWLGDTSWDVVTKYNSAGVQQWVAPLDSPGTHLNDPTAITTDGFGNVYVTGISQDTAGYDDYATLKYNSAGVQKWVARYNGLNLDNGAFAVAVDGSGNVDVTGYVETEISRCATIQYDSTGVQKWVAFSRKL